jgi:hypothetical protein
MVLGSVPVRVSAAALGHNRSRSSRLLKSNSARGRSPTSLLPPSDKLVSVVTLPRLGGIVPVSRFDDRSRVLRTQAVGGNVTGTTAWYTLMTESATCRRDNRCSATHLSAVKPLIVAGSAPEIPFADNRIPLSVASVSACR